MADDAFDELLPRLTDVRATGTPPDYDDPEAAAFRLDNAERQKFLGRDPTTGVERWWRQGPPARTELRNPDGTIFDMIPD